MEADSTSSLEEKIEEMKETLSPQDEGALRGNTDIQAFCSQIPPDESAENDENVQESITGNQSKHTELHGESSETACESVVQRRGQSSPDVGIVVQDDVDSEEKLSSSIPQFTSTETTTPVEVTSQCHEDARAFDDSIGRSESHQDTLDVDKDVDKDVDAVPHSSSDMQEATSNLIQNVDNDSETISSYEHDPKGNASSADPRVMLTESQEELKGSNVDQEASVNFVSSEQCDEIVSNKASQSTCASDNEELVESKSMQNIDPVSIASYNHSEATVQSTELTSHTETLLQSTITNTDRDLTDESEVIPPQMSVEDQEVQTSICEGNAEPMDVRLDTEKPLEETDKHSSEIHSSTDQNEDGKLSDTDKVKNAESLEDEKTEISKCVGDNPDNCEMNEIADQSKIELPEGEETAAPSTDFATENAYEETCVSEADKEKETEEPTCEQAKEDEGEQAVDLEKDEEEEGEDEEEEDDNKDESESKSEKRRASPIRCFDESNFSVESLFEYQWPQDHGEYFFVQEQISEYLGVTSFKRKYPALERRLIALEERKFLKDKGVVTEEQVTLGLTALKADEVYDVMQKDFPDKYAAYARLIQERQREAVKNQHKEYGTPAVDSAKMKNYIKKAVRQAAEYNASLMREKREERQYYLDLQTMLIHCPKNKMKHLTREQTKPGPYPVAVIPGQYQNYYKSYTTEELKYLPINTALYGPTATHKQSDIAPNVPPGSEISSDDEDLSVSSEPPKPSKSESSSKPTSKTNSKSPKTKGSSKSTEKQTKRIPIEPTMEPERMITPGYFKDQMQSVLPNPQAESLMMSQENTPAVSLAPPPPVSQVLSQLLQQKNILPPKTTSYVPKDIPDAICGLCLKDRECNRKGEPEELVHCSQCDNSGHPSCLEMSPELVCAIKKYPWQCMECKTCTLCGDPTHEDKMMFCDECDRGYHTFCVGLSELPTGLWACASCRSVPPAAPLPPPPETPSYLPPALNGTPESTTAKVKKTTNGDKYTNGTKRPAEPLPTDNEPQEMEKSVETSEKEHTATPPPAKKRSTKKKATTPKPSVAS